MYYFIPYRFSLESPQFPLDRLTQLAEAGSIDLKQQDDTRAWLIRSQDQVEWLSPVIGLRWDHSQHLNATLRPRRWLRRILRGEIAIFLLLMVGLLSQQNYFLSSLVLGLVGLNHTFIYLLMRRRFREARHWLIEQLG